MLHDKFQYHRTSNLEKKIFLKVLTIYEHGSHLSHVTLTIYINFVPPSHGGST